MRTAPGRTLSLLGNHSWKGWRVPAADAIRVAADFGFGDAFERVALAAAEPFRGGQEIEVPITIAFGRHDMLLRRRTAQYRGELPQSTRWLTLAGCGHVPMWDDPEAVAELVLTGTSMVSGARLSA